MTTAWSHLPNAKHIDCILAHLKKNPEKWDTMSLNFTDARIEWVQTAQNAAAFAARRDVVAVAAIINETTASIPTYIARGAIFALIAYPDCAYLLCQEPKDVQMLSLLGNQQAILLYPSCVAMQKEIA